MQEQQPQAQPLEGITSPEATEQQHLKTLAIRIEEGTHAQLRFIAQLSGTSISDEIREAIAQRIAAAHDDPDLLARAETARQEIEREAAARSAAIAGFLGKPSVAASTDQSSDTTPPKGRRSRNTEQ